MVKKKVSSSIFSTLASQLVPSSNATTDYHQIDNEYYAAFSHVDDLNRYHSQIEERSTASADSNEPFEMDMKSFAEQFLIDVPEPPKSTATVTEQRARRTRRNIRDLPQSSSFIYMSDNDHGNIFDCLQEDRNASTTHTKPKKTRQRPSDEATIAMELAEPSVIKEEPLEPEQLVITHVTEAKEEPVEVNFIPTGPMGFGRSEFPVHLDNYVQNIHRSCSNTVSLSTETTSSRPKRIRKRKKFFSEESETVVKRRRLRKKAGLPVPPPLASVSTPVVAAPPMTDAEIEQQFGERLSPTVKTEPDEIHASVAPSRVIIEIEPVPQTPIERARSKLDHALERGHGPDTFPLKIRSKENKIIEVQLAIYSTADWYGHRTKILSKIEEALRGLRVNWTKIDIRVDDFDIQICTSPQAMSSAVPPSLSTSNASWFLKVLSESGPLIIHIHDRRYPQQRQRIQCPCPQCSPLEENETADASLPIIVHVSPSKSPVHPSRCPPSILRQRSLPSHQNIHTTFFKDLVHQHGTATVTAVTQCVLDLTLIVSVHHSLHYLQTLTNDSPEEYRRKYQQVIDPLKYTPNEKENFGIEKNKNNGRGTMQTDIIHFYHSIRKNRANIRNAQAMRTLINSLIPKSTIVQATPIATTLILSKPTAHPPRMINRLMKRHPAPADAPPFPGTTLKQQAHFTPIIELKPILTGPTHPDESHPTTTKKITKIISTNTIPNDVHRRNAITTQEIPSTPNGPRVIRLSIAKSSLSPPNGSQTSPPTIRLISPSVPNKGETVPLVPKQINIIKPLASSSITATKLTNPILIGPSSGASTGALK